MGRERKYDTGESGCFKTEAGRMRCVNRKMMRGRVLGGRFSRLAEEVQDIPMLTLCP